MRRLLLAAPLAGLALTGCTTGPSLAVKMSAYVGQPESVLVSNLGVPDRRLELDGVTYFAYVRHEISYWPGTFGYGPVYYGYYGPIFPGGGFPPYYRDYRCTATFAIKDKRVQSFTLRGNDCD